MNRYTITRLQIEQNPVRAIGIFAYPGAEVLDIVGPMEVFTFANLALQAEELITDPVYQIEIIAKKLNEPIPTLSGLQIVPTRSYEKLENQNFDTLIIPGGINPDIAANDDLVECVVSQSPKVRRLVSVCTGAFILAKGGLLEGKRVTTHWGFSKKMKEKYPYVNLEPDRIYIKDGKVWSSGGITSGIDLALALLEEDWGHKLAVAVAQYLVVFLKRPGGQSQYSAYLASEATNRRDIRELQAWIMEHPNADLRVEALAERLATSPRNFARIFLQETGVTPAKYVEMVRIDMVRHYLLESDVNINEAAQRAGFKDIETMRRTFLRHVGINPSEYRSRFGCE